MLLDQYFHPSDNPEIVALLTHFTKQEDLIEPFAIDDTIMQEMNQDNFPTALAIHFWPTDKGVFLGMQDTRLPRFEEAVRFLKTQDYQPIIRSSGGLAVVTDPEVMNFTFIMKPEQNRPGVDEAYEILVQWLNQTFQPHGFSLTEGEVSDSYCPGKYDLSLNGKKVAGLSQRRSGETIGIYAYVSLSGNQRARGELIRRFYEIGKDHQQTKATYPDVNPESMTTVDAFVPDLGNPNQFNNRLLSALEELDNVSYMPMEKAALDDEKLQKNLDKMKKRNKSLK